MRLRLASAFVVLVVAGLVVPGVAAVASPAAVPVAWTEGAPSPFAATRFDGQFVNSTNRVYFLGFRQGDDSTTGEVWYYSVSKKKYIDTGTSMPVPVSNYQIAPLNDSDGRLGLYIFGGRAGDTSIVNDVQVYYPDTNTAEVVASDPWPGTTPSGCISLPATGVVTVDNYAYVIGGASFSGNGCLDENSSQVWRFNPVAPSGTRWQQEPSLTMARGYITPAVLQGTGPRRRATIYAIGGDVNNAGTLEPQTIVERWKLGNTAWNDKRVADLPEACDESQAFGFDTGPLAGTVTLAGCGQWPSALPDVLQYNVVQNAWSTVGSLNEARRNQAGTNIGTTDQPLLFVLGGYASDGATVLQSSEIGKPGLAGPMPRSPSASEGHSGRGVTTS